MFRPGFELWQAKSPVLLGDYFCQLNRLTQGLQDEVSTRRGENSHTLAILSSRFVGLKNRGSHCQPLLKPNSHIELEYRALAAPQKPSISPRFFSTLA